MNGSLYFNLNSIQQNHLYGITVQMGDRVVILRASDKAAPLVLPLPPVSKVVDELTPETANLSDHTRVRFRHGDGIFVHVDDMIRAAVQGEQEMRNLNDDHHMSVRGRDAKRVAILEAGDLAKSLAKSNAEIQRMGALVDAQGRKLYAVPRPADVIEAMEDREIRDSFWELTQPEQASMLAGLGNVDDKTLPALLRSPVPLGLPTGLEQRLAEIWAERVQAINPEKATRYKMEKANADWARETAGTVAGWASSRGLVGDKPTCFKAVRGIPGGPKLFGMTESEIEYFSTAIRA